MISSFLSHRSRRQLSQLSRHGDYPKVVIKDPLQPHLDMLRTSKDDDIHNLTAYLVTLK